MTIAGEDLLVVMRASAETGRMEATANYYVRLVSSTHACRGSDNGSILRAKNRIYSNV
jgi:hypothetical protein